MTNEFFAIDYAQVDWAGSLHQSHVEPSPAYVIEKVLPSGTVRYELFYEPLTRQVGRTVYWTNTAGATSSTTYLGRKNVQIVNVPSYILDPQESEHPLPRWAIS